MNRKTWWLFLIGLAGLILACGVSTPVVEEPTAPPPTPVSATATSLPPSATPVPPTAAPPPPTEKPTKIPDSGQVISEATGACLHPFYPVRSDTTWHYQTQLGDDEPTAYSVTYDDIGASSFTSLQTFPGSTEESPWLCTDEGLIPGDISRFVFIQIPSSELETLDFSGALLPPPDEWAMGATWQTGYQVQVTTKVLALSITSQADISVDSQIAEVEQIVVPAGAYTEAVRVDSTGTALINTAAGQSEAAFAFSHWYVEGVGLVKIAADVQGTTFDLELLSIE